KKLLESSRIIWRYQIIDVLEIASGNDGTARGQLVELDGFGPPPKVSRPQGSHLHGDAPSHLRHGLLAGHDRPRRRELLQPRSDVDGVADGRVLLAPPRADRADNRFPCVNPYADFQTFPPSRSYLFFQFNPAKHVEASPDRLLCVILGGDGSAKDR